MRGVGGLFRFAVIPGLVVLMAGAIPTAICAARTEAAAWRTREVQGAGGVSLNVVYAGDPANPAILFIHGTGQSTLSFDRQLRSDLVRRFFLVAFDLRGHGNSAKPWEPDAYSDSALWAEDVARVIADLQLRRPVIVGWSYGTMVALDYLRAAGPDSIAGLVLVGALGGLTSAPPPPPDERFLQIRADQASADLERNILASRAMARYLTARRMPEEWLARSASVALLLPRPARAGMFARSFDNTDLLPAVQELPLLVIIGSRDGGTPESAARQLAERLPRSRVSIYRGDGHSPFVESPARFNRELAAFVDDTRGRANQSRARRAFSGSSRNSGCSRAVSSR